MIKLIAYTFAFLSAIIIVLQTNERNVSHEALNKLHLPLEKTDYFQQFPGAASGGDKAVAASVTPKPTQVRQQAQHLASSNKDALQTDARLSWSIVQPKQSDGALKVSSLDGAIAKIGLARKIQRELRRAGCGNIPVNGRWDNRTKEALFTFVDNSNASLPIHSPEDVLLVLVQNYKGRNCGLQCIGPTCGGAPSKSVTPEQRAQLISPSQLANKPGSHTIVSGWRAEMSSNQTVTVSETAQKSTSAVGTVEQGNKGTRVLGYRRCIDTTSFGGERMALGAQSDDAIISEKQSGSQSSSGRLQTDSFQAVTKPVARRRAKRTAAVAGQFENASAIARRPARKIKKRRKHRRRRGSDWKVKAFSSD